MAVIGTTFPTLRDIVARMDPQGRIGEISEVLSKFNPILNDLQWKEANEFTTHLVNLRTSLPTPTWRSFNKGVKPAKSTSDKAREPIGMLETYSKIDAAEPAFSGNGMAFRKDEDDAHIAGFHIEAARALFYESEASNQERITGLTPRLNATSGNPAASQIIKADATAAGNDQTSIWLVGHGLQSVYCVYPKGSTGGLQMEDLGKVLTEDRNGNEFTAWVTHFMWYWGLVVADWRYLVRICNIDTSAWRADVSSGADILISIEDAISAMYELNTVQPVLYMNRATRGMFAKQMLKKQGNLPEWIQMSNGERLQSYNGIPIRVVDAITNTESPVV